MSIRSLQQIIIIENELHAAEQVEQKKISLWLKEREEEILRQHEEKLTFLEKKIDSAKEKAVCEANDKAATLIRNAQEKRVFLDSLEEDKLRQFLEKYLKLIIEPKL